MTTQSAFGDSRLKKEKASAVRGSRDDADVDRVREDGSGLSDEERRKLLRKDWVQEVLPSPPVIAGFHCCWLSTTNSTDPVYKRIQRGYTPVKASEAPALGSQYMAQGGEFDGCVACNEMLLFKIPMQLYQDLMTIYHSDMPLEQEAAIRENINSRNQEDSNGRQLASVEGDFEKFGRSNSRNPTFI